MALDLAAESAIWGEGVGSSAEASARALHCAEARRPWRPGGPPQPRALGRSHPGGARRGARGARPAAPIQGGRLDAAHSQGARPPARHHSQGARPPARHHSLRARPPASLLQAATSRSARLPMAHVGPRDRHGEWRLRPGRARPPASSLQAPARQERSSRHPKALGAGPKGALGADTGGAPGDWCWATAGWLGRLGFGKP
jgi:hypothetical protein